MDYLFWEPTVELSLIVTLTTTFIKDILNRLPFIKTTIV